jgi:hypothetical protein
MKMREHIIIGPAPKLVGFNLFMAGVNFGMGQFSLCVFGLLLAAFCGGTFTFKFQRDRHVR